MTGNYYLLLINRENFSPQCKYVLILSYFLALNFFFLFSSSIFRALTDEQFQSLLLYREKVLTRDSW